MMQEAKIMVLSSSTLCYRQLFEEKVIAPDGEAYDSFGYGVCASDSYYVVGAPDEML